LFSRKLDVKRALKMLESNLKWRKENGHDDTPDWAKLNKPLIKSDFAMTIPGARTKNGHGIIYGKFGNMVPDDHPNFVKDIMDYIMWNNMVGIFLEDMEYHRNGVCFIADMKSTGWRNLDMKLQKTVNSALMDNFPMKISQVIVLHPPAIFKPLLAGARLFVKKKILDRIEMLEPEDLLKFVAPDQLAAEFGGKITYTIETYLEWVDQVLAQNHPPATPIKVELRAKSRKHYPRDLVPHIHLSASDEKEINELKGAKSARVRLLSAETETNHDEANDDKAKGRDRSFSQ